MKCEKPIFNPDANDDNRKLFCSETTNILNLDEVKYPFFISIVDSTMYPNNWLPQKVSSMDKDKIQYEKHLTNDEREAFDTILSFLIFLDSIQTNNLPKIAEYITLPEIVYFLTRQAWEEALHSRSYGYIVPNVMGYKKSKEVHYLWRKNKVLFDRIEIIAGIYEECNKEKTEENFLRDIIANYLLEGLYFYNGFQFFHNLASRNLMIGTDIQIKYIQRDENLHCLGFRELINIYREEYNPSFFEDIVYDMFEKAVERELIFSNAVIGNKILGITEHSIEDYTYYLANKRLKDIGLEPIFPKRKNPYKHLDKIASVDDESSNRINNFEETSITYKDPSIFDGWDKI